MQQYIVEVPQGSNFALTEGILNLAVEMYMKNLSAQTNKDNQLCYWCAMCKRVLPPGFEPRVSCLQDRHVNHYNHYNTAVYTSLRYEHHEGSRSLIGRILSMRSEHKA